VSFCYLVSCESIWSGEVCFFDSSEESKKQDLAGQILSQLDEITERHLASSERGDILASNQSKPRGFERATGADPTDVAQLATEISFDNIYSETIVD